MVEVGNVEEKIGQGLISVESRWCVHEPLYSRFYILFMLGNFNNTFKKIGTLEG